MERHGDASRLGVGDADGTAPHTEQNGKADELEVGNVDGTELQIVDLARGSRTGGTTHLLAQARAVYLTSFPERERMPLDWLERLAREGRASMLGYVDPARPERLAGLAYAMASESLTYVLYLAVNPEAHSHGYGSAMLRHLAGMHPSSRVALDVERADEHGAPNPGQRRRRMAFYERNGFVQSGLQVVEDGERYDVLVRGGKVSAEELAALFDATFGDDFDARFVPRA